MALSRYIFRYLSARGDDFESRSSNLGPSVRRPKSSECECLCPYDPETQEKGSMRCFDAGLVKEDAVKLSPNKTLVYAVERLGGLRLMISKLLDDAINEAAQSGGKEEVESTINCSQMDALTHIISEIVDQNLGSAETFQSNFGRSGVNISDQCLHTCCRRRKSQNLSLEMGLEATLLLSSVHAAGAYAFGQMIRVRERDPITKRSLEAFIVLFGASFLCTFLGALTLLIIVSSRKYYQYKKLCLVMSNTASFVLMMIGYGFVVAFNM
ncbi:hypothetical protein MKW92_046796 [Papaver armeniacum]|nr:hypothetical protein MKW92_046796 [Papaver armeniacum]